MFNDYKDIVFSCFCVIWFITDIVLWQIYEFTLSDIQITNLVMIGLFGIITMVKYKSKRFNDWLNTPIKYKNNDNLYK